MRAAGGIEGAGAQGFSFPALPCILDRGWMTCISQGWPGCASAPLSGLEKRDWLDDCCRDGMGRREVFNSCYRGLELGLTQKTTWAGEGRRAILKPPPLFYYSIRDLTCLSLCLDLDSACKDKKKKTMEQGGLSETHGDSHASC